MNSATQNQSGTPGKAVPFSTTRLQEVLKLPDRLEALEKRLGDVENLQTTLRRDIDDLKEHVEMRSGSDSTNRAKTQLWLNELEEKVNLCGARLKGLVDEGIHAKVAEHDVRIRNLKVMMDQMASLRDMLQGLLEKRSNGTVDGTLANAVVALEKEIALLKRHSRVEDMHAHPAPESTTKELVVLSDSDEDTYARGKGHTEIIRELYGLEGIKKPLSLKVGRDKLATTLETALKKNASLHELMMPPKVRGRPRMIGSQHIRKFETLMVKTFPKLYDSSGRAFAAKRLE